MTSVPAGRIGASVIAASETRGFERAQAERDQQIYVLRLYITGMTERSRMAVESIRRICEDHLAGRYDLEVIDITLHSGLARDEKVIAAPTLIKQVPPPLRRLVGTLSDQDRVLAGLDIRPDPPGHGA